MRFTMSNTYKLAAMAGVLAIGGLLAASPAQAGKYSSPQAAFQHYEDCLNWLISDPAKHAKFCDPGTTVFVSGAGGSGNFPKHCCWCCDGYSDSNFKPEFIHHNNG